MATGMGGGSMSTDLFEARLERRIAELLDADEQFAAAWPKESVAAVISDPQLRLPQLLQAAMQGYAERPAVGQRAVEYLDDPRTGRTSMRLLPRFETFTYSELWQRAGAVAAALADDSGGAVRAGDRVCMLGFTGFDYTVIDLALMRLGAVGVPLQTSAPVAALRPIIEETEPRVVASSIEFLGQAVELIDSYQPALLVVFDYHPDVDEQRDIVDAARARSMQIGSAVIIQSLRGLLARGRDLPSFRADGPGEKNPLALLLYTSGSTGTPKGAMYPASQIATVWRGGTQIPFSSIILSFMPMSHMLGRGTLYMTLAQGGTAFFAAKSDLSTFLDDLALVRPTQLPFVPRIWDMLYQEYQSRLARAASTGNDQAAIEALRQVRNEVLGGRFINASTASAPIAPELKAWVESLLDGHLTEAYGSTEVRLIAVDGRVQRPPVIDYKILDVPELGYFGTDRPYPRGELLVKSADVVLGYYKRPELTAKAFDADGWYHSGDIVAALGPDRLEFVDRRNNVLKLSQGEFVAVSKLETVFCGGPLVRQIYIYANSARPYLVAVVVPTEEALAAHDVESLKPLIGESLRDAARSAGLQSYEIPRDFIVETTPFTLENGLLTGIRKLAWPKLKEHYGSALEQLYTNLAEGQDSELRDLRRSGSKKPVLETIGRAGGALLGVAPSELRSDAHFTDLGGDSLSALTFSNLLREIYGVDVPVGVIISPSTDLASLATYIEAQRRPGTKRPTAASVHGRHRIELHARDLMLDKFIDIDTLRAAPSLPGPSTEIRTVLLTGATGFLGRYLALEWLQRMQSAGGSLVCLVRATDNAAARKRLDNTFDSGDPELSKLYRELAAEHLQVLAGDKAQANLGLDQATWQRLADTVDLIVDPAALVNHMLPYDQLFGPNTLGTAELIRIALTTKQKPIAYLSTIAVGTSVEPAEFIEAADIRMVSASRKTDDSYANGYSNSKWASEVLLREAHDLCRVPVSVFRSDMILAASDHAGQLNVPDMFTRLMLSLVASGLAPKSFYALDGDGNRQRAHYDGLPVEFIAEAVAVLGGRTDGGFQTYHVTNPYDDGIGLDEYVDWLIDAGYSIHRIDDYDDWRQRFETTLRALPDHQRQSSLLPLMLAFQKPLEPMRGSVAPADRFRAAVRDAKIGPHKDIPHISPALILKYITDLHLLGLL